MHQKLSSSLKNKALIARFGWLVAILVILSWGGVLFFNLSRAFSFADPLCWLWFLVQTHLFTGLFITAHDAMHGTVSPNRRLNNAVGRLALGLFALNSWKKLLPKHHEHHRFVGTEADPDYGPPAFWSWYFKFVKTYISLWQIVGMAILFNIAKIWINEVNLIFFYVVPSVLSTMQLFYFGTYLPHQGEHASENKHKSRTLPKNHLWAFVSCYFFGYHYEHHDQPGLPWWLLYRTKTN